MILATHGIIGSKAAAAPGGIVTNGLVLRLEAEGYTGGQWLDQSGNNKHFTPAGLITYVSNGLQSYFQFDGSDDKFTGPASNSFGIGNDHTIELGMRSEQTGGGVSSGTVLSFTYNGGGYGIHLAIPENNNVKYDIVSDSLTTGRMEYTDPTVQNINIGWSFRKFSDASPYRMVSKSYLNNERINKPFNTPYLNTTQLLDANAVRIGENPGKGEFYRGRLYYFRVYNRKLTEAELDQNWAIDRFKLGLT